MREVGLEFSFLSLCVFSVTGLIKRVWQCSLCFYYAEQFDKYKYYLLFEVLVVFCIETIWSRAFFLIGRLLMTVSISFQVMGLFKVFNWS